MINRRALSTVAAATLVCFACSGDNILGSQESSDDAESIEITEDVGTPGSTLPNGEPETTAGDTETTNSVSTTTAQGQTTELAKQQTLSSTKSESPSSTTTKQSTTSKPATTTSGTTTVTTRNSTSTSTISGVTLQDSARLAGYLFGDGTWNAGTKTWSVRTPNGTGDLVAHLMAKHGAEDLGWGLGNGRTFDMSDSPYNWDGSKWYDSLPDDNSYMSAAAKDPNFLAAVIEGEGDNWGLVMDHSTNAGNPNYTTSRLTAMRDLLQNTHGMNSVDLELWNNPGSGEIRISSSDYNKMRSMPFVCPSSSNHRVPGGVGRGYNPINWIDSSPSDWASIVGAQCAENAAKIGY